MAFIKHGIFAFLKPPVESKRSDHRLKRVNSCADYRAWSLDTEERRHNFLNVVNNAGGDEPEPAGSRESLVGSVVRYSQQYLELEESKKENDHLNNLVLDKENIIADKENEIEQLLYRLTGLVDQYTEGEKELKKTREKLDHMEKLLGDLQKLLDLEESNKENDYLHNLVFDKDNIIADKENEIEQLLYRLKDLVDKYQERGNELRKTKEKLNNTEKLLGDLQTVIESTENDPQNQKLQLDELMKSLQSNMQEQITNLENDLEKARTQNDNLEKQLTLLASEGESDLKNRIIDLTNELENVTAKMLKEQKDNLNITNELEKAKKQNDDLGKEIKLLTPEGESDLKNTIIDLTRELQNAKENILKYQDYNTKLENDLEEARKQNDDVESEMKVLASEGESDMKSTIIDLRDELKTLKAKMLNAQENNAILGNDLEEAKKQNEDLKDKIKLLSSEGESDLKNTIIDLTNELEQVKAKLLKPSTSSNLIAPDNSDLLDKIESYKTAINDNEKLIEHLKQQLDLSRLKLEDNLPIENSISSLVISDLNDLKTQEEERPLQRRSQDPEISLTKSKLLETLPILDQNQRDDNSYKIKELDSENKTLMEEIDGLKNLVKDLEKDKNRLQSQLKDIVQTDGFGKQDLQEQENNLIQENESLRNALLKETDDKQKLHNKLDSLDIEKEHLMGQLTKFQSKSANVKKIEDNLTQKEVENVEREEILQENKILNDSLVKQMADKKELENKLEQSENVIAFMQDNHKKLNDENTKLKADLEKHIIEASNVVEQEQGKINSMKLTDLESENNDLRNEINLLKDKCNKLITSADISQTKSMVEKIHKNFQTDDLSDKIKELEDKNNKLSEAVKNEIDKHNNIILQKNAQIEDMYNDMTKLQNENQILQSDVDKQTLEAKDSSETNHIQQIINKNEEIKNLNDEVNELRDNIGKITIESLKNKELQDMNNKLLEDQQNLVDENNNLKKELETLKKGHPLPDSNIVDKNDFKKLHDEKLHLMKENKTLLNKLESLEDANENILTKKLQDKVCQTEKLVEVKLRKEQQTKESQTEKLVDAQKVDTEDADKRDITSAEYSKTTLTPTKQMNNTSQNGNASKEILRKKQNTRETQTTKSEEAQEVDAPFGEEKRDKEKIELVNENKQLKVTIENLEGKITPQTDAKTLEENSSLLNENNKLKEQVTKLENQLNEIKKHSDMQPYHDGKEDEEKVMLQEKLKVLEQEVDGLTSKLNNATDHLENAKAQLKDLSNAKTQLEECKINNKRLEALLKEEKDGKLKFDVIDENNELRSKIKDLEEGMKTQQLTTLNEALIPEKLEDEPILSKENIEPNNDISYLLQENKLLKRKLEEQQSKPLEASSKLSSQELNNIKNENTKLLKENQSLKDKIRQLENKLNNAQKNNENKDKEISELNAKIRALEDNLKDMKHKLNNIEHDLAKAKTQATECQEENEKLLDLLNKAAETGGIDGNDLLNMYKKKLDDLTKENSFLNDKILALEKELKKLKDENINLKQTISEINLHKKVPVNKEVKMEKPTSKGMGNMPRRKEGKQQSEQESYPQENKLKESRVQILGTKDHKPLQGANVQPKKEEYELPPDEFFYVASTLETPIGKTEKAHKERITDKRVTHDKVKPYSSKSKSNLTSKSIIDKHDEILSDDETKPSGEDIGEIGVRSFKPKKITEIKPYTDKGEKPQAKKALKKETQEKAYDKTLDHENKTKKGKLDKQSKLLSEDGKSKIRRNKKIQRDEGGEALKGTKDNLKVEKSGEMKTGQENDKRKGNLGEGPVSEMDVEILTENDKHLADHKTGKRVYPEVYSKEHKNKISPKISSKILVMSDKEKPDVSIQSKNIFDSEKEEDTTISKTNPDTPNVQYFVDKKVTDSGPYYEISPHTSVEDELSYLRKELEDAHRIKKKMIDFIDRIRNENIKLKDLQSQQDGLVQPFRVPRLGSQMVDQLENVVSDLEGRLNMVMRNRDTWRDLSNDQARKIQQYSQRLQSLTTTVSWLQTKINSLQRENQYWRSLLRSTLDKCKCITE